MRRITSILLLAGLLSGCATLTGQPVTDGEWKRVCRPGHAVRFAIPEGQPVPPEYHAPQQGSCMR